MPTLTELKDDEDDGGFHCQYPYGDRPPFTFCDAKRAHKDTSYCDEHDRLCHNGPAKPINVHPSLTVRVRGKAA